MRRNKRKIQNLFVLKYKEKNAQNNLSFKELAIIFPWIRGYEKKINVDNIAYIVTYTKRRG